MGYVICQRGARRLPSRDPALDVAELFAPECIGAGIVRWVRHGDFECRVYGLMLVERRDVEEK